MKERTTPFDMVVVNQIDRFHIAIDALRRAERLRTKTLKLVDMLDHKLTEHVIYTREQSCRPAGDRQLALDR